MFKLHLVDCIIMVAKHDVAKNKIHKLETSTTRRKIKNARSRRKNESRFMDRCVHGQPNLV